MTAAAISVYPDPGRVEAALLALMVHLVLFALLFFGVQWQSTTPEIVSVELWERAPTPPPAPAVAVAPPVEPEVKPEPVIEPKPEALPKPVENTEPKPDIALKEKLEKKKKEELKRREEQQKQNEAKRRQVEREQALKEQRERLRKESELLQVQREAAQEESRLNAQRAAAKTGAINEYVARIRAKIRANILVPDGIVGNPEAVFDVVQLPSGDILSAKLSKSSGHAGYDAAVERAILKSSPLPKPAEPGLFRRELTLKFRPRDSN